MSLGTPSLLRGLPTLQEVSMAADNFSSTNPLSNYRPRVRAICELSWHAPPRGVESEQSSCSRLVPEMQLPLSVLIETLNPPTVDVTFPTSAQHAPTMYSRGHAYGA